MNSTMPETTLPYDLSARLSYLGELFVHRRVLVVSDDPSAAMFLAGLNARYVCSISEKEVTAPAGHRTTVEFKIVSFDDLRFRDGMFDVALIPDLGALPPSAGLFVELRRVVGRRGRVVVAAVNPACTSRLAAAAGSGIDYYEMYDLLSHTFDVVQMAGQAPFVGYAVSDLGAGEDPDISFDGSLMADATEEIEWFIAVCGAEPVSLEGLAIVQVPLSSLSLRGDGSAAAALSQENDRLSQEVEVLREDVARLDQDLRLAEDDLRNLQQSAPDPDELESLKAELHRVKLEVGTRGVRIETLENDLEHERREAEAARARAVQLAKQYDDERKAAQARQIEEQIARRQPSPELQAELAELKLKLKKSEDAVAALEKARDDIIERTQKDARELERLSRQAFDLQRREKEFLAREETMHDQLAMAHRELRTAREAADAAPRLSDLEAALTRASAKEKETARMLEAEKARSAQLIEELEKSRAGSSEGQLLEKENAELESHLAACAASLKEAKEELDRREALTRDLTAELNRLSEGNAAAVRAEGALRQETDAMRELEHRAGELEAAIGERDRRIAKLEGDLQAAAWKNTELEARSADVKRALEEATARRDDVVPAKQEDRVQSLENELAAALGAISGHHRARVEVELSLAAKESKLERALSELDEAIARTRELEDELAAAMGAISGHHRARVEAELEISGANARYEKVRRELDEVIAKAADMEQSLVAVTGALQGQRAARREAEMELATVERRRLDLVDKWRDAVGQVVALEEAARRTEEQVALQWRGRIEAEAVLGEALRANAALRSAGPVEKVVEIAVPVPVSAPAATTENEALVAARETAARLEQELLASTGLVGRLQGDVAGCDAEIVRLRNDVAGCDAEIARLRSALSAVEGERDGLHSELDHLRHARQQGDTEVAQQLAQARLRMEDLEALNRELTARLHAEEERTREAGADAARLSGENEDLRTALLEQKHLRADHERERSALQEALVLLREELGTKERALEQLKVQRSDLARPADAPPSAGLSDVERQRLEESIAELTAHVEILKSEMARQEQELKGEQQQTTVDLHAANAELSALEEKTELIQEKLAQAELALSDSMSREESLARQLEAALQVVPAPPPVDLSALQSLSGELQQKDEELRQKDEELRQRDEELRQRDDVLQQKIDALARKDAELAEMNNRLMDQQMDFAAKNLEISQARGAERAAREQLRKALEELDIAKQQAPAPSPVEAEPPAELLAQISQLESMLAISQETIEDLKAAAVESQPLIESLTSQLEQREQANTKLEKKLRMLQSQIKESEGDVQAWDMELKFRDAKIAALEEEIAELKTRLRG